MYSQMKFVVFFVALLADPLVADSTKGSASEGITVCQLLADRVKYEGQLVRVRGSLRTDGVGSWPFDELHGIGCAVSGVSNAVVKLVSPDVHFLAKPPANYRPDPGSAKRAERLLERELAKGHSVASFDVTIDGVFFGDPGEARPSARHKQYSGYVVIQSFRRLKAVK